MKIRTIDWMALRRLLSLCLLAASFTALSPTDAEAIPAFAKKTKMPCQGCHQFHYPRLTRFGRMYREQGYQMPGVKTKKLGLLDEGVPISMRSQVFGVVAQDTEASGRKRYKNTISSFILGGGSVATDVSAFFSWTPFPNAGVHQARIGLHNIASETLGEGALNMRAGAMFLLDFQRPGHRFLASGAETVGAESIGQNRFTLEDSNLGVQIYGRPGQGPLLYELAVVSGDPGPEEGERDDWKDVFGRLTYTFFYNTDHEISVAAFGYKGRSEMQAEVGGAVLVTRDEFWIAGGDIEIEYDRAAFNATAYTRSNSNPYMDGRSTSLMAARAELFYQLSERLIASARLATIRSEEAPELEVLEVAPHLSLVIEPNVVFSMSWRQDLENTKKSTALFLLDTAY